MADMAKLYNKTYGVDYVNLGYKANYTAVLLGMGSSIESIYPADQRGTPLSQLPLMQRVKSYKDISFIFIVADNGIVDNWISIVNAQFSKPMGAGVTAVMAPKFYSYVQAKQMTGLLGGMKGAAEYELLVNKPAMAMIGMNSQSTGSFADYFLRGIGNVAYLHDTGSERTRTRNGNNGTLVRGFLTLALFSFLYKDNPFYRLAEHIFAGLSAGYYIGLIYQSVIVQQLGDPISQHWASMHGWKTRPDFM